MSCPSHDLLVRLAGLALDALQRTVAAFGLLETGRLAAFGFLEAGLAGIALLEALALARMGLVAKGALTLAFLERGLVAIRALAVPLLEVAGRRALL